MNFITIFLNDSPECLEVHELGVAVDGAGCGEDDKGEEAVVDVAVRAEVLARVRAPDLQVVVGALREGQRRGQLARLSAPLSFSALGIPPLLKRNFIPGPRLRLSTETPSSMAFVCIDVKVSIRISHPWRFDTPGTYMSGMPIRSVHHPMSVK